MRDHWKTITTVGVTVILLALLGFRVKRSFAPQAPAVLNYEQHTSPGFTFDGDLRRAWKNVESLLNLARREEKSTLLQLASLSLVQICQLPNDALIWDTIEVRNPGFESLRRIERIEPGGPAKLVGYYTLEGKPLDFDTKTDLRNTPEKLTTVDLNTPLAAGKSVLFFRVQRTPSRVSTNGTGKCVLTLGLLSASPSTIQMISVALPKPAKLVTYQPGGALVTASTDMDLVTWVNTKVDAANRAIHVTFTIPK